MITDKKTIAGVIKEIITRIQKNPNIPYGELYWYLESEFKTLNVILTFDERVKLRNSIEEIWEIIANHKDDEES